MDKVNNVLDKWSAFLKLDKFADEPHPERPGEISEGDTGPVAQVIPTEKKEEMAEQESMTALVSKLFVSRNQAHIFHLGTSSFSEHKALNMYYDEIVELVDGIAQSTSGIYGNLSGYTSGDVVDWTSTEDTIAYFRGLYAAVQTERKAVYQDSYIQNQIDEICQLLGDTIYQLKLNK